MQLEIIISKIFHSFLINQKNYYVFEKRLLRPNLKILKPTLSFSVHRALLAREDENEEEKQPKKKKKNYGAKFLVIDENNSIKSMFKHEIEKYAKSKKLEITQLEGENKTADYKLETVSQALDQIKDSKNTSINFKKFKLNPSIGEQDLKNKLNQMLKNLDKGAAAIIRIDRNNNAEIPKVLIENIQKGLAKHNIKKTDVKSGSVQITVYPSIDETAQKEEKKE